MWAAFGLMIKEQVGKPSREEVLSLGVGKGRTEGRRPGSELFRSPVNTQKKADERVWREVLGSPRVWTGAARSQLSASEAQLPEP